MCLGLRKSVIFLGIFLFIASVVYGGDISKYVSVSNAWVQAMPPVSTNTAAYMEITNNSSQELVLVGAHTPKAKAIEIHQMSDMDGMMQMDMKTNIHIPALGKVFLKPGGNHLMLINLKNELKKGDLVEITLDFEDGSHLPVKALVGDEK